MKKLHSYLQMDTKLQRKELFKLWIQRKGYHSKIKSEYVQNNVRYVQIFMFVIKNLGTTCEFHLWKWNKYLLNSNCCIFNFKSVFIASFVNIVIIIVLQLVLGLKKILGEQ
jgi:hypothetical protein